ncbi:alpha/beta hydrolase [Neisseria leonii]|uniref:alpha/beta hydrolase n=1 Tax=Neisseria leonii TaxID=2995413 RepID=UPI00237B5BD5|nr:alpha/beta hydrolase [Neisseria sp. 3986]MDD9325215.1 alpha/beta hydrolase [Neisseria sp. 3986]
MVYRYDIRESFAGAAGGRIYLKAYLPRSTAAVPALVFGHEFGASHRTGIAYAENLAARGFAVVLCDFRGGGLKSRSEGEIADMSLLTERDDLLTVLEEVRRWPGIDAEKTGLIGASMGALAAGLAAVEPGAAVAALVLFYPAMILPEDAGRLFASPGEVPERYDYRGWLEVGRRFFTDIIGLPVLEKMAGYRQPALLLHGTADELVAVGYSDRVAAAYADMRLVKIAGAPHSFRNEPHLSAAMGEVADYLAARGLIPPPAV